MMRHAIHRVTGFEQLGTYTLRVVFDDGVKRRIDFEPVLEGGIFAALRDPDVFRRVRLDPETGTLVWPNGADFDPATLYDWPRNVEALVERVRSWGAVRSG